MPSPFEEIALKDLVKHPKLIILYAAFIGIGWAVNRLVPDDCHKEVERWQLLYTVTARGRDSVQSSKDVLYEQLIKQKQQYKRTDSLIFKLGRKAEYIFKHKNHEHP